MGRGRRERRISVCRSRGEWGSCSACVRAGDRRRRRGAAGGDLRARRPARGIRGADETGCRASRSAARVRALRARRQAPQLTASRVPCARTAYVTYARKREPEQGRMRPGGPAFGQSRPDGPVFARARGCARWWAPRPGARPSSLGRVPSRRALRRPRARVAAPPRAATDARVTSAPIRAVLLRASHAGAPRPYSSPRPALNGEPPAACRHARRRHTALARP
jgi:hypothetical protein